MKKKPRILIADDDAFIRRPLEWMLSQEGFEPQTVADGDECMEMLRSSPPDLLILDVMMPGLDGFEVCRRIRSDQAVAHVPVVMVTALSDASDRVTGLEAGAIDLSTTPGTMLVKIEAQ